jgi:hypothetical protein
MLPHAWRRTHTARYTMVGDQNGNRDIFILYLFFLCPQLDLSLMLSSCQTGLAVDLMIIGHEKGQSEAIESLQLAEDGSQMGFDRSVRDVEPAGDLLIG